MNQILRKKIIDTADHYSVTGVVINDYGRTYNAEARSRYDNSFEWIVNGDMILRCKIKSWIFTEKCFEELVNLDVLVGMKGRIDVGWLE